MIFRVFGGSAGAWQVPVRGPVLGPKNAVFGPFLMFLACFWPSGQTSKNYDFDHDFDEFIVIGSTKSE